MGLRDSKLPVLLPSQMNPARVCRGDGEPENLEFPIVCFGTATAILAPDAQANLLPTSAVIRGDKLKENPQNVFLTSLQCDAGS